MTTTHPNRNQVRRVYPSHLETFEQCRLRYRLKVLERRSADQPFSPALAKGNAAHQVLKICGSAWKESVSMPADLRSLVAARLPRSAYLSDPAWESDVADVVAWVKYGLGYLDLDAKILGVEQHLDRHYRPEDGSVPVSLAAVIDMLLLRTDSDGKQFIEIIDYKSGRSLGESIVAPVVARFVVKPVIAKHLPGDAFVPTVFTQVYLAKRYVRTSELTLERCLNDWEEVKRILSAISVEREWAPTPSPLCQWCEFNGSGCLPTLEDEGIGLW